MPYLGPMKKIHLSSTRSSVARSSRKEGTSTQSKWEVVPGSLIWVRLNGDSWWPAQVVDRDSVSESNKPSNRLAGEVLVRLYGSHKHLYADPLKCRHEFESVLKQNNGSCHDVFLKALERELPSSTSAKSKERGSKHTERRRNGASKDNGSNQDTEDRTQNLENKSGDADAEGYTDLSAKRTAGHRADLIADQRSKMKLGCQRAEGATLKTFHRGKTHRKGRLSDNQDLSNCKDGLPTTPITVPAVESSISGRERIDKCLEQKNGSTENLKIRTLNQDVVKKNHELNKDNASVSAKGKNSKLKEDSVSSRIKLYGRSAAEKAKLRISGKLGPQVKPKAIVTRIWSKVERKSLKQSEVKNEQKLNSFCQHEKQGHGEVDRHDSMPQGLKRKARTMDRDKECKISKQEENWKNCKPSSIRVDENSTKLDRSVKKLKANKRKTEQDNVQKELQPNIKYAKEERKAQATKQVELVEKQKPVSATAPSPSSTGKAQELCPRRLRVMRSLGLVSPAGSPF